MREAFTASQPLHINLRVLPEIGELRTMDLYAALRKATQTAWGNDEMRIVHVSVQNTHVHLIVETRDRFALSRGMAGFKISAPSESTARCGSAQA